VQAERHFGGYAVELVSMSCVTCGAPGHDTGGTALCIRHGGVPSAAFVAALVGEPDGAGVRWPDRAVTPAAPDEAGDDTSDGTSYAGDDTANRSDEPTDDPAEEFDDRPPAALRAYTWLFLAVTAVHIALLLVDVLVLRREDMVLRRFEVEPASLELPATQAVFALVDRVAGAATVALWVTLLMFAVWFGVVGRVAERLGHDRQELLRHWTYLGWRVALVPLVVYLFVEAARQEPRPEERSAFVAEALAVNHTAIMFASLRVVMLALLAGFVVVVWRRLSPRPPVFPDFPGLT
jgi:hypothetical protein